MTSLEGNHAGWWDRRDGNVPIWSSGDPSTAVSRAVLISVPLSWQIGRLSDRSAHWQGVLLSMVEGGGVRLNNESDITVLQS